MVMSVSPGGVSDFSLGTGLLSTQSPTGKKLRVSWKGAYIAANLLRKIFNTVYY